MAVGGWRGDPCGGGGRGRLAAARGMAACPGAGGDLGSAVEPERDAGGADGGPASGGWWSPTRAARWRRAGAARRRKRRRQRWRGSWPRSGSTWTRTAAGGPEHTPVRGARRRAGGSAAGRGAGAVLVTDGQAHDRPAGAYPFPVHALIVGRPAARDVGVRLVQAPRSAPAVSPARPRRAGGGGRPATVGLSLNGRAVGTALPRRRAALEAVLPALPAGENWIEAAVTPPPGDLSRANDRATAAGAGGAAAAARAAGHGRAVPPACECGGRS
jgi:hypothetical protein